MSKNGEQFGTFKLRIKRNGAWEDSIQSECEAYLERTARNWLEQGMIEVFRIDLVPAKPQRGAFGFPINREATA